MRAPRTIAGPDSAPIGVASLGRRVPVLMASPGMPSISVTAVRRPDAGPHGLDQLRVQGRQFDEHRQAGQARHRADDLVDPSRRATKGSPRPRSSSVAPR